MTCLSLFLILGLVISGLVIGRQSVSRRELQTAADAMALAGAFSLEQHGLLPSGSIQSGPAMPFFARNTRLAIKGAVFNAPPQQEDEHRAIVSLNLSATFDTAQTWIDPRFRTISVSSTAQINEMIFGEVWPTVIFLLDASLTMQYSLLGDVGHNAFEALTEIVLAYARNTLPVRNGAVVFNSVVLPFALAPPPSTNTNNLAAITTALRSVALADGTNTRAALATAQQLLESQPEGVRRYVILLSDGQPTRGDPSCPPDDPCHILAAEQAATGLRQTGLANLVGAEIRHMGSSSSTEAFLRRISGKLGSAGNDPSMYEMFLTRVSIGSYINKLTRIICTFGPLEPHPGSPADDFRLRPSNPHPPGPPQRIFAFLRTPDGAEELIPKVEDRDIKGPGFEYAEDDKGAFVILTLDSCNDLGADAEQRLVVRWDDPQLIK